MTPAEQLYAVASAVEREAMPVPHEPDEHVPRRCARGCWRCYLDARASLYGRAGDAAKALET